MSYRTIIVGTDGSESSLRAVDRAGALAAQVNAKLIIASAHLDTSEKGGWSRPPTPERPRICDPSGCPRPSEGRRRPRHRRAGDCRRAGQCAAASGRGGQRRLARRRQLGIGYGRRPSIGLRSRHRCPQSQSRHPHRPHRRIALSAAVSWHEALAGPFLLWSCRESNPSFY
jgi:hypothetical protein